MFVRADDVSGGSERNGRLSLFLLPAGCSVDVIAVHVSPTGADWLEGRDQQKVPDVKLVRVTKRFRSRRPRRDTFVKVLLFVFHVFCI